MWAYGILIFSNINTVRTRSYNKYFVLDNNTNQPKVIRWKIRKNQLIKKEF
jgi:hypothetical protein